MSEAISATRANGALDREAEALLRDLVAIPSINPAFRRGDDPPEWFGERAIGDHVAEWLRRSGLEVELDPVTPDRRNVVARLAGRTGRGHLLWEGHLDTVQVTGMTVSPFAPVVTNGRLYGRGAADDKGCLAAFMLALRELARDPPDCNITFVGAVDEEYEFKGVLHHLARGEPNDGGIAGEPTGLRLYSACKGCVRWSVEVRGRAAHTSKPEEGIDAIAAAMELLGVMRAEGVDAGPGHPLLGRSSFICTMIEGGEGPNTVPASVRMKFDYRYLPSESGSGVWRRFKEVAETFGRSLPEGAAIVVHPPFIDSIAMDVVPAAAIVTRMQEVCRSFGVDPTLSGAPFGSDASKMTHAGVPTLIFGPGSIDQAHTKDEFVEIAQVARAAEMLAALARRWGS